MDQPLDSLTLDWALLRDRLSSPPTAPVLTAPPPSIRRPSAIARAILLCRIACVWTALNATVFVFIAMAFPLVWLRLLLMLFVAASVYELVGLYRIERLLQRSRNELDVPTTVYARAAAHRLKTWRRAAERRSYWLIPCSFASGLAFGMLEGAATHGNAAAASRSLSALPELLSRDPALYPLLAVILILGSLVGIFVSRWLHQTSFGPTEARLRAWSAEAAENSVSARDEAPLRGGEQCECEG
jgi:hypothetical protein